MAQINLKDLGVTLGEPLFAGLTVELRGGDRVGLVAANGRGKSTLLRCIAGLVDPTMGEITRSRGMRIGLVEQEVPPAMARLPLREAVASALDPVQRDSESWRVDVVLDELQIPDDLRDRPLADLSGGWQRMALLARVWITEPDALLLDEPTNHLDLERIGQVQRWLRALPRDVPLLIASHDRAFLDEVTNRTLFLRAEASHVFALPYSRAKAALAEADEATARRHANQLKQAAQLRKQAAKLKNIGINSGSDLLIVKTKQLSDRAEKIEAAARPAFADRSAGAIRLTNSGTHAKALVALDDAQVAAPDGRGLFRTGKLWISPGDRVVLLGRNGAGKTRLVDLIHAAFSADVPGVKCAPTLKPGYADQGLTSLGHQKSPMALIAGGFDVGDQMARTLLAGAGIRIDRQPGPVGTLSGGQKARLAMLVLRLSNPNFYLLDEPTNHLDIEGAEALEGELLAHGAACLLVSHDRSFVRAVANRFWQIEGKRLVEVDGPEPFFAAALDAAV